MDVQEAHDFVCNQDPLKNSKSCSPTKYIGTVCNMSWINLTYLLLFPCLSVVNWFGSNLCHSLRWIEAEMLGLIYSKTLPCLFNARERIAANLISSRSRRNNRAKTKSYKLCPHAMTASDALYIALLLYSLQKIQTHQNTQIQNTSYVLSLWYTFTVLPFYI